MLSDRFFTSVSCLVPFMNKVGVILHSWNPQTMLFEIETPKSRNKNKMLRLNMFLMAMWFFFVLQQLVRFHINNRYNDFNLVFMFLTAGLIILEVWLLCISHIKDSCSLFNGIILFLRRIHRK